MPRTRLGEALARIQQLAAAHRLRVANVFHAGDGNLHPLILFDGREAGALERAEALAADILRLCISWADRSPASTASASRSARFSARCTRDEDVRSCSGCAQAIDPQELANRGKMLGGGGDRHAAHGLHPLERAGVISRV